MRIRLTRNVAPAVRYRLRQVRGRFVDSAYTRQYYLEQDAIARRSAEVVVPRLIELVEPRSVADVGCGSGRWLSVFLDQGVEDVLGVESEAVPEDVLAVPPSRLVRRDLRLPLKLDRTFELVICLEVVEHLPRSAGDQLIASLTSLSSLVLFSAAIPHQGGTGHINEEWPEYWANRFREFGYVPIDCLRRRIWNDRNVAWWYAQNILLFADDRALRAWPKLADELNLMGTEQLSIVHPSLYESRRNAIRRALRTLRHPSH